MKFRFTITYIVQNVHEHINGCKIIHPWAWEKSIYNYNKSNEVGGFK